MAVIDTNPTVALSDGRLNMTISGRYNFGGLVSGKAKISFQVLDTNSNEIATFDF